ncbi:class I SAM-dependent methyltransferase [Persephonella sp.]
MAKVEPFERFTQRYDSWFEKHRFVYFSELEAIKSVLPGGTGLEVGVGTGRFASPLGIQYGVEPSINMAKIAYQRGINVVLGVAENLPFKDKTFDFVLFTTTICFVDDLKRSFEEACRVLKKDGCLIAGFIDRNSKAGQFYMENKNKSPFYADAVFYSTEEVLDYLRKTCFSSFKIVQTVFGLPYEIDSVQPVKEGYGEGSFVVIKAIKQKGNGQ